jgi:Tol biopolymer transport system component
MHFSRIPLVMVMLALAGLCATEIAAQTSVNGQIAFNLCEFGPIGFTCDIWVMNSDGSEQLNITETPDLNETDPAWSSDGTRIAYVEGDIGFQRLMVVNADGSGRSVVTQDPTNQFGPTWSPDGTRLAFVRLVPGEIISTQFDILAVNLDGTGEVNLTQSDFDERDPAWAPDGTRIAFAGVRFENWINPVTGLPERAAQWEIVTINPDGSDEQILTAGEPGSERATHLEEDRGPAWSPDSTRLVFMTQSVDPCCPPWQIAEVLRDGTGLLGLSDNPDVNDLAPEYSPDGTLIVFTSDRDAIVGGDFDIYTMPATRPALQSARMAAVEASATRLTFSGRATNPTWGRDPGSGGPETFPLSVSVTRTGQRAGGVGLSWPLGIRCGRRCEATYDAGTRVFLLALPNRVSFFAGWSGACKGRSLVCLITMDDARSVRASFVRRRR